MEHSVEVLRILATSWPIAVVIVASIAGYVIRRTIKQRFDAEEERYRVNNAVVIHRHNSADMERG